MSWSKRENSNLLKWLHSTGEERYLKFYQSITPNNREVLGVSMPKLRRYIKTVPNKRYFLEFYLKNPHLISTSEHELLLALALNEESKIITNSIEFCRFCQFVELFSTLVSNWGSCDALRVKIPTPFCENYFKFLSTLVGSKEAFTARVGIVGLISFIPTKKKEIIDNLKINNYSYYVKMACAWILSEIFISECNTQEGIDSSLCLVLLKSNQLETFIHNKTISKICDSLRVKTEIKQQLRHLRQKSNHSKTSQYKAVSVDIFPSVGL